MAAPIPSFHLVWTFMTINLKSNPGAVEDRVSLRQVHTPCAIAGLEPTVAQTFQCRGCEKTIPKVELDYGYEYTKGTWVVLSKDEVTTLKAESNKTMEVLGFVPKSDIDPLWYCSAHYLGPNDDPAMKNFVALRTIMTETNKVALVQYTGSGHDKVGIIRPYQDVLLLHQLWFAKEIRSFEDKAKLNIRAVTLSSMEVELLHKLIDASTIKWDPERYQNGYMERVRQTVAAKIEKQPLPTFDRPAPVSKAQDLTQALLAALEAKGIHPGPTPDTQAQRKPPAKSTERLKETVAKENKKAARRKAS